MNATAFRIAIREARASRGKFLFVILAVALGVGSLTGVRGFSQAFGSMLLSEARSLMAADISVRIFGDPHAEQDADDCNACPRGTLSDARHGDAVDGLVSRVVRSAAGHVEGGRSRGYSLSTASSSSLPPGTLKDRLGGHGRPVRRRSGAPQS